MASRILVIQFRLPRDTRGEQEPIKRVLGASCELVFKNAIGGNILWTKPERELRDFSGVILSGSSVLYFDGGDTAPQEGRILTNVLVEEAKVFAKYLIDHDIPTLGICFGHQLLGYAAGARIGHSHTEGKTGTYKVELTDVGEADPIMQGVPASFMVQYGHKDVIMELPQGAEVLARGGDCCRFSALKYAGNVYSVQFHPEFSREEITQMVSRFPEYIPQNADIEELFDDSEEAEQILRNFAEITAGRNGLVALPRVHAPSQK